MAVSAVVLLVTGCASATRWHEYKGLFAGMPAAEAKKLRFSCQAPTEKRLQVLYDEKCILTPGNTRFSTFGGEAVTEISFEIRAGIVDLIYVKTKGAHGGGLEAAMIERYGKPKVAMGDWKRGAYSWNRGGAEYISLNMSNGVNEVVMGYDIAEIKLKQREAKAKKDF